MVFDSEIPLPLALRRFDATASELLSRLKSESESSAEVDVERSFLLDIFELFTIFAAFPRGAILRNWKLQVGYGN
jgi:hypothetical protein